MCRVHAACPSAVALRSAIPNESGPQGNLAAMKIISSTFTNPTVSRDMGEQGLELSRSWWSYRRRIPGLSLTQALKITTFKPRVSLLPRRRSHLNTFCAMRVQYTPRSIAQIAARAL